MSSIARHHAEWLSLLEISGPFLSIPVLQNVFPQGLDAHEPQHYSELRAAYEEWLDNQGSLAPEPAIHTAWIRYILENTLEYVPEVLASGQAISSGIRATFPEHNEVLRPDYMIVDPDEHTPRMLIQSYPARQGLERALADSRWKASPATRMMELLHATDIKLGLVTNGEQWMLVHAPRGETTGYISWYADLWTEEKLTLRAFRSLLGLHRFFGVPEAETLETMIAASAQEQHEVTDQLGKQVRRAVEILVQAIDRADVDRGGILLTDVNADRLYEAALTVMMRLVFLLSAEERGLLLLGDPIYDQNYAISTLLGQQRELADQQGEEVLERRYDAWSRLLATFRAVYGGIQHDRLRLPAYGSSLFDPDKYPFLEGRQHDTHWRDTRAYPLPINNRTVLHLLSALQYLQVAVPGSSAREARRLSFRALDIEQIGHVYEGLLDHVAVRADEPVLGFAGTKDKEPEILLSTVEAITSDDDLVAFLREETGRSPGAIQNGLGREPDPYRMGRLRAACGNDEGLYQRVLPYLELLRDDDNGFPVVILPGSMYVTEGATRRQTGTHYTPRSLTEPIVQHTLEPLVYIGPAEGHAREDWRLRPAADLLDLKICDMAMGSGAFLVQACRYLSERLVEAWEEAAQGGLQITPEGQPATGDPGELIIPIDTEERLALARRLIADRCLYGVDKNPLAVEMAKLSLWLITMDKGRAFNFLDHALKCGDSLIGVSPTQLRYWRLDTEGPTQQAAFAYEFELQRKEIVALRRKISQMPVNTIDDQRHKAHLLSNADKLAHNLRAASDALVWSYFNDLPNAEKERFREALLHAHRDGEDVPDDWQDVPTLEDQGLDPFHWELEFPEVFLTGTNGFGAFMSNPPFIGGKRIRDTLGDQYREALNEFYPGSSGNADYSAFFFLRGYQHLRQTGALGLIATNTIAQGETRRTGLERIIEAKGTIYRAENNRPWPGQAAVSVSIVHIGKGEMQPPFTLDDIPSEVISSYLDTQNTAKKPHVLLQNEGLSHIGSYVNGMGFILTPDTAEKLLSQNSANEQVIFPYLNAKDLNDSPSQEPSRWIINFFDWSLEKAETFSDCMAIIRENVYPERIKKTGNYAKYWWQYGRRQERLYEAIDPLSRLLVCPVVSKYVNFVFVPKNWVYAHRLVGFAFDQYQYFAVLQSNIHECWARTYSSTLETRINYSPTDCFQNFPIPQNLGILEVVGQDCHETRRLVMLDRQEGLTDTYNRFHDPDESAEDIVHLRDLHVEMDYAVAAAYGWDDLGLGHDFHDTAQGVRFTISESARREVLTRLLKLNHARYEEEVKAGLHGKAGKGQKKAKKSEESMSDNGGQLSLF